MGERARQADRIGFGILCCIGTFFIFSTNDAVVKLLGGRYSAFMITFGMSLFALLPNAALVAATGGLAGLRPRSPVLVMVRAVLMLVATLGTYTAFKTLSIAETYTLVFTSPLIVTALSGPVLGEHVGWRRWLAVAVGFAGVLVMLRPGVNPLGFGHLAAFASAATFGLSSLILRRGGNETSSALLTPMIVVKGAGCGLLMLVIEGSWGMPTLPDLGLMAFIGIGYGVAHILLIIAFRHAPAAVVAPFQYLQMVGAVFYGVLLFDTWPDVYTVLGSAIVMASGIYIGMRESVRRPAAVKAEEAQR